MLANNPARDNLMLTEKIPAIGKGFLHRSPLLFIPEALCLKNAYASAYNAYFIFHLVCPHIFYSAKQVPGDFDYSLIGVHFCTVLIE